MCEFHLIVLGDVPDGCTVVELQDLTYAVSEVVCTVSRPSSHIFCLAMPAHVVAALAVLDLEALAPDVIGETSRKLQADKEAQVS